MASKKKEKKAKKKKKKQRKQLRRSRDDRGREREGGGIECMVRLVNLVPASVLHHSFLLFSSFMLRPTLSFTPPPPRRRPPPLQLQLHVSCLDGFFSMPIEERRPSLLLAAP